ncbi:MAG: hypothetical protein C5B54_05070 [Acidobacteria bacterium]|nr:MAG: hypothetical protein C5B54_05070 [Acidobacteriota bacterium]
MARQPEMILEKMIGSQALQLAQLQSRVEVLTEQVQQLEPLKKENDVLKAEVATLKAAAQQELQKEKPKLVQRPTVTA